LRVENRVGSVFSFLYLNVCTGFGRKFVKTNPSTLKIAVAKFHCSRRSGAERANLAIHSLDDATR